MTDRELLELAAKAAGMRLFVWGAKGSENFTIKNADDTPGDRWNPLTDDGDALRLAVKLGEKYPAMVVGIFNRAAFSHTSASVVHREGTETYVEQDAGDDLAAATRRAIVRAAAAIGEKQ